MKPFTYWEDLGKPGILVNSGQIGPGKWQKNIKTWDSGSWKTWEMGKMTWENLGLAPSGGVDTLNAKKGFIYIYIIGTLIQDLGSSAQALSQDLDSVI
jgi:hypothetical protein